MTPVVSVIIPTAGRPTLVPRAVDSVLKQTMADLEVIVVIDGPDRETSAVLATIRDDRLRVIDNHVSLGPGSARNAGAAAARGTWIAFLDDDDEWLPQKLERQLSVIESSDEPVMVSCLSRIVTPRALYVWPRRIYDNVIPLDEYLFDRRSILMGDTYLQTSSVLMPRRLFNAFKFPPRRCHEDEELWLRATKNGGARIITVREPLVNIYTEEDRPSLAGDAVWQDSLTWVDDNRSLIGRRAYSGFCLTKLAPQAARSGSYSGFVMLLWIACRHGRPRPVHLLIYFAFGLIPVGWRRRVRGLLSHTPRAVKT